MDPPPQEAWEDYHTRFLPQWKSMKQSSQAHIPILVSRVNQFDAARLDVEMSAMLKEQLVKVFSLLKPGILFQYEAELNTFLEFLIWRFSIWVDKPTPGNTLMNLRYRDERSALSLEKEEQDLKDLDFLLPKNYGIVYLLLVVSIYGLVYNLFLLFEGGENLTRYCYYCLQTRWSATSSFRCVRCNDLVNAMQRQGVPDSKASKSNSNEDK